MGEPLDLHVLLDLDRTDLGNASEVVPSEIHQHVVLGTLLLVGEELLLEPLILIVIGSAGAGACEGEGVEDPIL